MAFAGNFKKFVFCVCVCVCLYRKLNIISCNNLQLPLSKIHPSFSPTQALPARVT